MKRMVLGAAVAALAGSAHAADTFGYQPVESNPLSGHVEGYLGGLNISFDSGFSNDDETYLTYGGAGRLNYNFAGNWNVQGDLFIDNIKIDEGDVSNLYGYGAAAHVYWRDPSSFALGAFASIETYRGIDFTFDDDTYSYRYGAEGQVYFDRVTLYGQLYLGQIDIPDAPVDFDTWGVRGVVRYFVRDNLRIDGELGFHELNVGDSFGPSIDMETFSAALQASYRFTGTPLTVFGRYQYDTTSVSLASVELDTHKFVIGLRGTFGSSTLRAEDRNGATMDVWRPNMILPLIF